MLKTIPELLQEIRSHVRCITAEQAAAEISENNSQLIDVREPEEVAVAAIAKSTNIPRGVLEMKASMSFPDPETKIYIHCASGARAVLAAEQLQRIGYRNVSAITCELKIVTDKLG